VKERTLSTQQAQCDDDVEVEHVLPSDVLQFLLAEQEHMIEGLASQTADEPLGNGIHVRGLHRRLKFRERAG
jgi:hypothetical protein